MNNTVTCIHIDITLNFKLLSIIQKIEWKKSLIKIDSYLFINVNNKR